MLRLKDEKDRRAHQLEALRLQQEMENPVLAKARKSTEEVDNAIAMLLKEVSQAVDGRTLWCDVMRWGPLGS